MSFSIACRSALESPGFRLAAVGAGVPQDAQPLVGPPGLRAHREELAATLVGRKLTELEYRFGLHRSFFFHDKKKNAGHRLHRGVRGGPGVLAGPVGLFFSFNK